ncbi:alpha/beta fold hydrolase [Streptacidiphilus jiangxiensis]|uniref:Pimeloyl-ACP methyl ester carboxylesterase n=1 Tax=Streptacidiphilus jiangxiensis TaxID=235985 RepID=A0A1H7RIE9_STRJI|nr:alpha/beta hydrolase [Streptacidiphilus jiangxiensis]SEL59614.1 Pimeloyl-ACP methyl ester carboxylesterase [Streptacidiphilus jiangxiensis]
MSAVPEFEELSVPVEGGELRVLRWAGSSSAASGSSDGPVVLALHGITANGLAWGPVAEALDGRVTLLAPDLRGRAASASTDGPWGIGRHADDAAAVVHALAGGGPVTLTGHSMGAYVAAVAAVRYPALFSSVLLVDGGVGFPPPPGLDGDELLTAVLGPAMARLSMTFASREAYREFWLAHPAVGGGWSEAVDAYLQRDLVGEEPTLRSSCVLDAVRVDGMGVFDKEVLSAVHELSVPSRLLIAERGLQNEPQGLLDASRIAAAGVDTLRVPFEVVPDSNHYSILTAPAHAGRIADLLVATS